MFKVNSAFSGFSINDLAQTEKFYSEVLGLKVAKEGIGLGIHLPGGATVFAYPKEDHQPASFTILNFAVDNIDKAYDALVKKGVHFEKYEGMPIDEKGILRGLSQNMGPDIAWFKDPSGNILSILQQ